MPAKILAGAGAYDIELGGVPLMLIRDGKPAVTVSSQLPAEQGQAVPLRQQVWFWSNAGGGSGASYQSKDADDTGMIEIGVDVWNRDAGAVCGAGQRVPVALPGGLAGAVGRIQAVVPRWRQAPWFATGTRVLMRAGNFAAPTAYILQDNLKSESLALWGTNMVVGGRDAGIHVVASETAGDNITGAMTGRFLATPYWAISNQIATAGGANSQGGRGAPRLILTSADGTGFYHLADPNDPLVVGNWSGLVRVVPQGQEEFGIVGAVQSNRMVWFPTAEGVRGTSQTGYSPNFNPWMRARYDVRNGSGSVYWRNAIWYPHRDGLVMVRTDGSLQDSPVWVHFGAGRANQTSVWGRPRALYPHGRYLLVAFFDDVDSYIMALTIDPDGRPHWYGAESVIRGEEVTFMHAVSNFQLYIATITPGTGNPDLGTGTMHLWMQRLPFSDSPLTDIRRGYSWQSQPQWSVTLPRIDRYSTDPKTVHQLDLVAPQNLSGDTNRVAIETATDDGAFSLAGTASNVVRYSSSPSGPLPTGVAIQPRLTVTQDVNRPVVIRSFSLWTSSDPQVATVRHYRVVCESGQSLKNRRGAEKRDPRLVFNQVLAMQGAPELSFVDETGLSQKVRLEPNVTGGLVEREDGRGWVAQWEMDVTVLVPPVLQPPPGPGGGPVDPPVDPPPGAPKYDSDYLYDNDNLYEVD